MVRQVFLRAILVFQRIIPASNLSSLTAIKEPYHHDVQTA